MTEKISSIAAIDDRYEVAPVASTQPTDPMKSVEDFAALAIDQSFDLEGGIREVVTKVVVKKPGRNEFIRVHPGEDYRADFVTLRVREPDDTWYIVAPGPAAQLTADDETRRCRIYTYISRQGKIGLWPVDLPTPEGKINDWHAQAHTAAEIARGDWTRIKANMSLGAYETIVATADLGEPSWPDKTFYELLDIGFKDRVIKDLDHEVLKRLRGEI
jgi:hypothetical protein